MSGNLFAERVGKMLDRFDRAKGKGGYPYTEERYAMRELLAERTELLEALKSSLRAFAVFYSFYGDDEHISQVAEAVQAREAMSAMRAAIAKAEGEGS